MLTVVITIHFNFCQHLCHLYTVAPCLWFWQWFVFLDSNIPTASTIFSWFTAKTKTVWVVSPTCDHTHTETTREWYRSVPINTNVYRSKSHWTGRVHKHEDVWFPPCWWQLTLELSGSDIKNRHIRSICLLIDSISLSSASAALLEIDPSDHL